MRGGGEERSIEGKRRAVGGGRKGNGKRKDGREVMEWRADRRWGEGSDKAGKENNGRRQ